MSPEQQALANGCLRDFGGSLEEYDTALNELWYACSDNHGHLWVAFQLASQSPNLPAEVVYNIARARDLIILHEIFKRLSQLPNTEPVALTMAVHMSHMNTPEGIYAVRDMLQAHYGEGPMVKLATDMADDISKRDDCGSKWMTVFVTASAIDQKEYIYKDQLPTNTEYPRIPNSVELN